MLVKNTFGGNRFPLSTAVASDLLNITSIHLGYIHLGVIRTAKVDEGTVL